MSARLAPLGAAPVDASSDRAALDPQGGGDLLVGEPLDVAENDCGAELRRQGVEGALDVVVEVGLLVGPFGPRLGATKPGLCTVAYTQLDVYK